MSIDADRLTVAIGDNAITYYDRKTGDMRQSTDVYTPEEEGGRLVAVQDLSGNAAQWDYLRSLYELSVGETARFRMLNIISKEQWEKQDVLFTLRPGYSAQQMQQLRYSQPQVWLNENL